MGRLTIDIPDDAHHHLKVLAANRGVSIKDYVMEKITPDLNASKFNEPSLSELAEAWKGRRETLNWSVGTELCPK